MRRIPVAILLTMTSFAALGQEPNTQQAPPPPVAEAPASDEGQGGNLVLQTVPQSVPCMPSCALPAAKLEKRPILGYKWRKVPVYAGPNLPRQVQQPSVAVIQAAPAQRAVVTPQGVQVAAPPPQVVVVEQKIVVVRKPVVVYAPLPAIQVQRAPEVVYATPMVQQYVPPLAADPVMADDDCPPELLPYTAAPTAGQRVGIRQMTSTQCSVNGMQGRRGQFVNGAWGCVTTSAQQPR